MTPSTILRHWHRLEGSGPGRWLFSRVLGWSVPYTGSIGATVIALAPGQATVVLRDRRAVRNHLGSVHAIALANLGELASGLAMLTAAGDGVRGIVTRLEIAYHAKARGRLTATGTAHPPPVTTPIDSTATAEIRDAAEVTVATVTATWRLAPVVDG